MAEVVAEFLERIASREKIDERRLMALGLISYLKDKKRKLMKDRLEILRRYRVSSAGELEEKIGRGEVEEHPAWEDLITVENLDSEIREISNELAALQKTLQNSP